MKKFWVWPNAFALRPQDYPQHVYTTGYWFLDEENWQPSKELQDFLASGPAPVYIGFGSMGNTATAEATTDVLLETLKRTGQRGVLAKGWGGMKNVEGLSDRVFMLEEAPHSWLFPKMAAVVHHGGAGTTAAGLRAGVPNIVIPHALDQFAWGQRVYELGVGPKPVPKKKLSVDRLSEAIQQALNPEKQKAAKQLGQKIQSENGNDVAVDIIRRSLEVI
ncbi:MAG: glycosyltransferase [Trueperaceae bacterium]